MPDITFFKPNELIAVIDQTQVNRLAKHLGNYLLKHAQEQIKFNNHQGNLFELNISETNSLAEIACKDYKLIEDSLEKLMQPVTIRDKDDPKSYHKLVPIYEIKVNAKLGLYQYRLAETMIELLQQTDYFTKLKLTEFNNLESKHSLVIYEWLKRYEKAPKIPQISIEELRQITNTTNKKTYDNFTNIKDKILDVAVKEITEKTPYTVTYEPIKERLSKYRPRVTAIQFNLSRKKPLKAITGTSGIVTDEILEVSNRYKALCDNYIAKGFCDTSAAFYQATYVSDFSQLLWFYNAKKDIDKPNKLKWLLDDIQKGKRHPRRVSQTDYYNSLVSQVTDKKQLISLECGHSNQGFLEQVLKLQKYLNENKKINNEKWL